MHTHTYKHAQYYYLDASKTPGSSFWSGVLSSIAKTCNLNDNQKGMLIPATSEAAGNNNNWDLKKLVQQLKKSNIKYVGTWAIGYDNKNNYQFAKTMGKINL